jgi:peptide-methionine (S)-S-oxide reductase
MTIARLSGIIHTLVAQVPRRTTVNRSILASISLAAALLLFSSMESPPVESLTQPVARETAVFAGGCFWGIEAVFEHVKGVLEVVSGYAGGSTKNPSYEEVSSGLTGHAEVVRVTYDPAQISYETLLDVFFSVAHDPTQLNRQGPDVGTQYRSAIFFADEPQQKTARAYIDKLTKEKKFTQPIVTEVTALVKFYPAESYHQDYMQKHPTQPYIVIHDRPKVEALRRQFAHLYR